MQAYLSCRTNLAPVTSEAWVRIPPLPETFFCVTVTPMSEQGHRAYVRPDMSWWCSQLHGQWLNGLGVWFSLWVREVPGSNPGWALKFLPAFCFRPVPKAKSYRGHTDLNHGPIGLQPIALPLSYIPKPVWGVTVLLANPGWGTGRVTWWQLVDFAL